MLTDILKCMHFYFFSSLLKIGVVSRKSWQHINHSGNTNIMVGDEKADQEHRNSSSGKLVYILYLWLHDLWSIRYISAAYVYAAI